jgi:hypothetical protein
MHTTKRLENSLGSTSAFQVESYLMETEDYVIATSTEGIVGVTWSRSEERPQGFPSSYKNQQWFMLPPPLARMVLSAAELFESNLEIER